MKSVFILSFFFGVCKTVFLLKMAHENKNTTKNTKNQPKKTVCETMNFYSTKLIKPKKFLETQQNGTTFS